MGDLSRNISRHEIACRCRCGFDTIDFKTLKAVQGACDYFSLQQAKRVILDISSGCRCSSHNYSVNGSYDSQHIYARAVDHTIREVSVEELAQYYRDNYPGEFGIGEYETFVHFDTRSATAARW